MTLAELERGHDVDVDCNDWEEPLYRPFRYIVLYGGRSSGKTQAIAKKLVLESHAEYHVIYCVREHQKSLGLSAKPAIENWINRLGLAPWFRMTTDLITNRITGSVFHFEGMSTVSEEDIKGWEGVTRCWVEEAHTMSHRSRDLIYPTIFRQSNSQFIATFNPKNRYDPIYEDFVSGQWGASNRYVRRVNYRDNPHFPEAEEELRREWEKNNPLTYAHEWLGEPDDASAEKKVLSYHLLRMCVDAWDRRPERGTWGTGGLDVADTGADYNALVNRVGPELFYLDRWHGSDEFTISHTTRHAAEITTGNGLTWLNYDEGGIGRGVRGPVREWARDNNMALRANGCSFGGKVQAETAIYEQRRPRSVNQAQFFHNWGAQAAMVLVIRANNTQRLLDGQQVDPGHCLFINPEIPILEDALADMSRAEWTDETGKYRVIKQPRLPGGPLPPSPDIFDAARLAYAYDARRGLPGQLK